MIREYFAVPVCLNEGVVLCFRETMLDRNTMLVFTGFTTPFSYVPGVRIPARFISAWRIDFFVAGAGHTWTCYRDSSCRKCFGGFVLDLWKRYGEKVNLRS